jgi:hypothetical protein
MIKKADAFKACKDAGLQPFRHKYYDAPPGTDYRLLDTVGATLLEVSFFHDYDGEVYVGGRKYEDLTKLKAALDVAVKNVQSKLTATPLDDKRMWRWLSKANMCNLNAKDVPYLSYTRSKGMVLLHCSEFSLPWLPFTPGSEYVSIAGSDSEPVGNAGHTLDTFVAWLESKGIKKKKGERY